jgi:hypothetical protein
MEEKKIGMIAEKGPVDDYRSTQCDPCERMMSVEDQQDDAKGA